MSTSATQEFSSFKGNETCHALRALEEVTCVEDSVMLFRRMTGTSKSSCCLYCTVPTWSSSSNHCVDLHDLYDLRKRSIVFLHQLLGSLQTIGVQATYRLTPSNTDLATISISGEDHVLRRPNVDELLETIELSDKGKTLVAVTERGPVILMT